MTEVRRTSTRESYLRGGKKENKGMYFKGRENYMISVKKKSFR